MGDNMITAQIASVPARASSLQATVNSLLPQVDKIFVALNGYTEIPSFIYNDKIVHIVTDNALGDAYKFYDADTRRGYVLTCDDDLVYPEGYVSYMINGIKKHKGIVTLLGKRYDDRPIKSFRKGYTSISRALSTVSKDSVVHVGGTGCMAYHTDHFNVTMDEFQKANMADLWVAKAAHEQGVKITVLAHPKHYMKHTLFPERIWNTSGNMDTYQTEVINSFLKAEDTPPTDEI
jgi:hypothetical protein